MLAVLSMIQIIVFRSFSGVSHYSGFGATANWSFGSIGFPTNLCSKTVLDWDKYPDGEIKMVFNCEKHTSVSEVFSSGIVSYANETDYPGLVESFAKCYYDEQDSDAYLFPYMQYFN